MPDPVPTDPRHGIVTEEEVDPTVEPTETIEGEEEAPEVHKKEKED